MKQRQDMIPGHAVNGITQTSRISLKPTLYAKPFFAYEPSCSSFIFTKALYNSDLPLMLSLR